MYICYKASYFFNNCYRHYCCVLSVQLLPSGGQSNEKSNVFVLNGDVAEAATRAGEGKNSTESLYKRCILSSFLSKEAYFNALSEGALALVGKGDIDDAITLLLLIGNVEV